MMIMTMIHYQQNLSFNFFDAFVFFSSIYISHHPTDISVILNMYSNEFSLLIILVFLICSSIYSSISFTFPFFMLLHSPFFHCSIVLIFVYLIILQNNKERILFVETKILFHNRDEVERDFL